MFRCLAVVASVVASLLLAPGFAGAQPASPVADLNTAAGGGGTAAKPWAEASDFTTVPEIPDTVFFTVTDGIHGAELWKTDGTAGGTVQIKDICPGICSSMPRDLTAFAGSLYFSADDGLHGSELWKSDGTAAGTVLVKDLLPGIRTSVPLHFAVFGSQLLLTARDDAHGRELWRSDGTAAGTAFVADLNPGPADSNPLFRGVVGGLMLFTATDPDHGGELWQTDGTPAGTGLLADLYPGPTGSTVDTSDFAVLGGKLYFLADDGVHGYELWASDGTPAGTKVFDLLPGRLANAAPREIVAFQNRIVFRAHDPVHGGELWSSDGTLAGTGPLLDIEPGAASSYPVGFTVSGTSLYFSAFRAGHGRELWKSDGTPAGTVAVQVLDAGVANEVDIRYNLRFHPLGNVTLFFADDGIHGVELWRTDGTAAGTAMIADLAPGTASFAYNPYSADAPLVSGGRLYFSGSDSANRSDIEVWVSDGTAAGTGKLREINSQASAIQPYFWGEEQGELPAMAPFGAALDRVIFAADDGIGGEEVWQSDGTAAGTSLIADLVPGYSSQPQGFFPIAGGRALFRAATNVLGHDLWRTDGTATGTVQLASGESGSQFTAFNSLTYFSNNNLVATDGNPGSLIEISGGTISGVQSLTPLGSRLLFSAWQGTPNLGAELWRSDGSTAELLLDIEPGSASSSPDHFTAAGPRLFFAARTAAAGRELWITDGTPAGTRLVTDLRPGTGSGIADAPDYAYLDDRGLPSHRFAALGNRLLFYADGGTGTGEELWISDGTAAGTFLLKDIFPGPSSSQILWMTPAGPKVYFAADDGVHGRELWVSDGTAAGTRLLRDLLPGAGSSHPFGLSVVDGLLLFSATDGVRGTEPWKTNGAPEGTFAIQDIAPGALPSSPLSFTAAGSNLYFFANDGTAGFELWKMPRAALSRFADVPPGHPFWGYVEALAASGITAGCGSGNFCPDTLVNRAQMSVFLGRASHGAGFVPPPATGTRFTDVPASYWAADWIEQIARDGVTLGCNTGSTFCPESQVLRSSMAIFLLRAKHGAGYVPPPATGARFADVPASYWAAAWIEQLAAEGITSGCGGGNYCPEGQVNRANLAAFLVRAFGLLP